MEKLISWVEIPTKNFDRAVEFYRNVLKIELQKNDFGKEKMAFLPGGEGAITYSPGFSPCENGTMVSFNSKDELNKTLERVEANGGKIYQHKTKIEAENRGYFAVFIDCEGNKMGLYSDK